MNEEQQVTAIKQRRHDWQRIGSGFLRTARCLACGLIGRSGSPLTEGPCSGSYEGRSK